MHIFRGHFSDMGINDARLECLNGRPASCVRNPDNDRVVTFRLKFPNDWVHPDQEYSLTFSDPRRPDLRSPFNELFATTDKEAERLATTFLVG